MGPVRKISIGPRGGQRCRGKRKAATEGMGCRRDRAVACSLRVTLGTPRRRPFFVIDARRDELRGRRGSQGHGECPPPAPSIDVRAFGARRVCRGRRGEAAVRRGEKRILVVDQIHGLASAASEHDLRGALAGLHLRSGSDEPLLPGQNRRCETLRLGRHDSSKPDARVDLYERVASELGRGSSSRPSPSPHRSRTTTTPLQRGRRSRHPIPPPARQTRGSPKAGPQADNLVDRPAPATASAEGTRTPSRPVPEPGEREERDRDGMATAAQRPRGPSASTQPHRLALR
jgi:hypothetical protein